MSRASIGIRHAVRRFLSDRRGTAAVELALLSPLLILLFFGTIEVTQLVRVEAKLAHSAQTIQDIVAAGPSTTSNQLLGNAYTGAQIVMFPFTTMTALSATIASVTFDGNGKALAVSWQKMENTTTGMPVATACTIAAGLSLTNDSAIVVQVTYTYIPIVSYVFGKSFTLTQTAYGRPRSNPAVVTDSNSSDGPTGNC